MRYLALAFLFGSGCSAALRFDQCNTDDQCPVADAGTAYCTTDHICTTDFPAERICTVDPVSSTDPGATTIAALFRLSGTNAADKDTLIANAVALAVNQINAGMSTPRQLRLVDCDTLGNEEIARKAMTVAVEKYGAVGVIGPSSSKELLAIARPGSSLPLEYKVPIVSPSATNPSISSLNNLVQTPPLSDGSPNPDGQVSLIWRTAASDSLQAKLLASTTVYNQYGPGIDVRVAYVDSPYGQGLATAYLDALGGNYPGIMPASQSYHEEMNNPVDVATFLGMTSPQVVLAVADADAAAWLNAFHNANGLGSTQFLFTDGAEADSLFDALPMPLDANTKAFLARVSGTGPAVVASPIYTTFTTQYKQLFGDPQDAAYIANAYDAAYALALAMAVVPSGKVYGTAVADGLSRLSAGMQYNVGAGDFAAAFLALAGGSNVDLQGASGPIDFDPKTGDVKSAPFQLWSVDTTVTPPKIKPGNIVVP